NKRLSRELLIDTNQTTPNCINLSTMRTTGSAEGGKRRPTRGYSAIEKKIWGEPRKCNVTVHAIIGWAAIVAALVIIVGLVIIVSAAAKRLGRQRGPQIPGHILISPPV